METLTRDQIFLVKDREVRELNIPLWGGKVRIQALTGAEFEAFTQLCRERAKAGDGFDIRGIRVRLIQVCLIDDDDKPLFSTGDLDELAAKDNKILEIIWKECRDLIGISDEAIAEMEGE